jgi:hypothetical protein
MRQKTHTHAMFIHTCTHIAKKPEYREKFSLSLSLSLSLSPLFLGI